VSKRLTLSIKIPYSRTKENCRFAACGRRNWMANHFAVHYNI